MFNQAILAALEKLFIRRERRLTSCAYIPAQASYIGDEKVTSSSRQHLRASHATPQEHINTIVCETYLGLRLHCISQTKLIGIASLHTRNDVNYRPLRLDIMSHL